MRRSRNIPRSILRVLLPVVIVAFIPGLASAQDRGDVNADRREEQVRIQVSVSSFFAGPTGDSDDALKLREHIRRSIYEMAAGECGLVQQVLAKTCRLESVNVNLNQQPNGQVDGYVASGNFALRVTQK
jgi:hypothetical protein